MIPSIVPIPEFPEQVKLAELPTLESKKEKGKRLPPLKLLINENWFEAPAPLPPTVILPPLILFVLVTVDKVVDELYDPITANGRASEVWRTKASTASSTSSFKTLALSSSILYWAIYRLHWSNWTSRALMLPRILVTYRLTVSPAAIATLNSLWKLGSWFCKNSNYLIAFWRSPWVFWKVLAVILIVFVVPAISPNNLLSSALLWLICVVRESIWGFCLSIMLLISFSLLFKGVRLLSFYLSCVSRVAISWGPEILILSKSSSLFWASLAFFLAFVRRSSSLWTSEFLSSTSRLAWSIFLIMLSKSLLVFCKVLLRVSISLFILACSSRFLFN